MTGDCTTYLAQFQLKKFHRALLPFSGQFCYCIPHENTETPKVTTQLDFAHFQFKKFQLTLCPFLTNVTILYPLKTGIFRQYKNGKTGQQWVNHQIPYILPRGTEGLFESGIESVSIFDHTTHLHEESKTYVVLRISSSIWFIWHL